MAKIISAKTGKEIEVEDGASITEACEKLGIPFACNEGVCGLCKINVVEGEENLSKLTEEEKVLPLDKKHRLACQARIKKGKIKIDF